MAIHGRAALYSSSAVVTEASTHLWRDVFRCILVLFYNIIFKEMENDNVLDFLNDVHFYCIRYAYLQRINKALQSFVESWNNHSVSSERSLAPNQLFIQGALRQNFVPNRANTNVYLCTTTLRSCACPTATFFAMPQYYSKIKSD